MTLKAKAHSRRTPLADGHSLQLCCDSSVASWLWSPHWDDTDRSCGQRDAAGRCRPRWLHRVDRNRGARRGRGNSFLHVFNPQMVSFFSCVLSTLRVLLHPLYELFFRDHHAAADIQSGKTFFVHLVGASSISFVSTQGRKLTHSAAVARQVF